MQNHWLLRSSRCSGEQSSELHAEVVVLHAEVLVLHAEVPLLHLDKANGYLSLFNCFRLQR